MKRILWVSRHEMTPSQRLDLERSLKEPVEITAWKDTVNDIRSLQSAVDASDVIAVVLPPSMIQSLLSVAGSKPVIRAVSKREPTGRIIRLSDGRSEAEFSFVHLYWEQILKIDLQTRRL